MEKEKMVHTAKTLYTTAKVSQIVFIVFTVVAVIILGIITVMYAVAPNTVALTNIHVISTGYYKFELTPEAASDSTALIHAWIMMALVVACIAAVCCVLGIIRKILAPMTQGDPFNPTVGKEIRRLAFFTLAFGIIRNILLAVDAFSMYHLFDLNALSQSSNIQSIKVNFIPDAGFFLVFMVLMLVSYIFQYGEGLQKLSDETL